MLRIGLSVAAVFALLGSALAGEWQAERLRGVVLMMVDGEWAPITRGAVIEDSRVIRTGANGQVTFRSGEQVIELSRNTQIQISAVEGRDHTWILQAGGEMTADVDARDVEHFGVITEHMVAVVKGTRFSVVADENAASVAVERGNVSVNDPDRDLSVSLAVGQRVTGGGGRMAVTGEGDLPEVVNSAGRPVPPAAITDVPVPAQISEVVRREAPPAPHQGPSGGPDNGPDDGPGNSENAPGHGGPGAGPGNSDNAPGRGPGAGPGNSENAPGHGGPGHDDREPPRGPGANASSNSHGPAGNDPEPPRGPGANASSGHPPHGHDHNEDKGPKGKKHGLVGSLLDVVL